MSIASRVGSSTLVVLACLLSSCGGGGGGSDGGSGPPNPPSVTPYAPLTQDDIPTGARVPLDMAQPYPLDSGTRWIYAQSDGSGKAMPDVDRSVNGGDGTGNSRISEFVGTDRNDELMRWTPEGLVLSSPLDLEGLAPGLNAALPQWTDIPTPLYPVNSVRRAIRQADLGADLDGDGKTESFRAELSQTNLGFESLEVLGQSRRVLHLRTQIQLTIAATRGTPITLNASEDSFIADGFGPVRLERKSNTSAIGNMPASTESSVLVLKRMRYKGKEWTAAGLSFSIAFNARGVAYDAKRDRFLASVDWADSDPARAKSIATINPRTAQVTYSAPFPDAPSGMAMAGDGNSVYVLMERSFDVRRLALPELTEIGRTPWPLGADGQPLTALALIASPTQANVFAIAARPQLLVRPGTVHLARDGQWLADKLTLAGDHYGSAAFSTDGLSLFALSGDRTQLVQADVLATGLTATQQKTVDGAGALSAYPGRLIAGRQVYMADATLALVGTIAGVDQFAPCVPLAAGNRIVCQDNASFNVSVVDSQTLANLGSASYNFEMTFAGPAFVAGPPGILAIVENQRLVFFASELLR